MHKLYTVLRTIRQDLADVLKAQAIIEACRHSGHRWRDRVLTPVAVIHWFLRQILLGNTAVEHVSLLAERTFNDSAYCQARTRIPLEVFRILLRNLNSALQPQTQTDGLWLGHRTFLIDGSAVSMPDMPGMRGRAGPRRASPRGNRLTHLTLALFRTANLSYCSIGVCGFWSGRVWWFV